MAPKTVSADMPESCLNFLSTTQCNGEFLRKYKDDGAEFSLISRTAFSVGPLSSEIG
jgi:hypothetical protein